MNTLTRFLLALVAFVAPYAAHADFTYNDFSDTTGLKLNGKAAQVGKVLRLTPTAAQFVGGSVFTTSEIALSDLSSFSTFFQFQMTEPGGASDTDGTGADGIVFVIQTVSNSVGAVGKGIGYGGITPSLGIEFDTFQTRVFNDPNGNHVGIDLNGNSESIVTAVEPTRFNNGKIWSVWIDYDGDNERLEVRWAQTDERPDASQLTATVSLSKIFGQTAGFVGFTAATGAAYENQDILHWEFEDSFSPRTAPTITSAATATGTVGAALAYQITGTHSPVSFAAKGLPAGLRLDTASGVISGTPKAAGMTNVALSATNAIGSGSGTLALTIQPASQLAPVITSAATAHAQPGAEFTYQITATNSPKSFAAAGLPGGLSVNPATGAVTGVPTTAGTSNVTLSATNAGGTGSLNLVLVVGADGTLLPVITSTANAVGAVGTAFTYRIAATNDPTGYGATGLPGGLSVDSASGLISGTPTAAGTFQVVLSASNASGADVLVLNLVIQQAVTAPPVITSAASVEGQVGVGVSYQITASNNPVVFAADGVPAGLTLDASTGLLSGNPAEAGTFTVTLSASNAGGTGMLTLTLSIAPKALPVVTAVSAGDGMAIEGGKKGKVFIERTGDISAPLTVIYKTKGSAKPGVDYKPLPGSVTISAGAASMKIKVKPLDNTTHDGTRKVKIKLLPATDGSYTVGDPFQAKIKIIDND